MNRRDLKIRERDVQAAVLELLAVHPAVAWAQRMNTGQARFKHTRRREEGGETERVVRFAFKGCADIIGQLTSGQFLAVEVKRPGGRATPDQQAFIENVNRHGGLGLVADDAGAVAAAIDAFIEARRKEHEQRKAV